MSLAHKFKDRKRTEDVIISETVDFSGLLLSKLVLQGLSAAGFQKPSPIQLKAIPLGRCGLDLIVQAKSGTGKTCVFTVIALESIELTSLCVQVLVLAPTREIAQQIHEVVKTIGVKLSGLKSHTFIGGLPLLQDKLFAKSCHIAVGTPGRVKQLIDTGALKTNSIRLFVLDEADKLLEGDFQESINWIYSTLPENKQILALSATYPEHLAQHLTAYMRNPTFVRLNISDPALLGIKQYHVVVPNHPMPNLVFNLKTEAVVKILSSVSFQQCLIFSNMQMRAQNLQSELQSRNWPTVCIAGCLDQKERNFAMEQLKTYKCRILISTDLTSRGIDADKVNLVINMDVPADHETYLHRIGRAGRFGSYGAAITIVSSGGQDKELWAIEKKCKTHIQKLPDPIPKDIVTKAVQLKLDDIVSSEQIFNKPEISSSEVTSSHDATDQSLFLKGSNTESVETTEFSNVSSEGTSHADSMHRNKEVYGMNNYLKLYADSFTKKNIHGLKDDTTSSVAADAGAPGLIHDTTSSVAADAGAPGLIHDFDGEKSADELQLPIFAASSENIQCNKLSCVNTSSEAATGSLVVSSTTVSCSLCLNEVCTCLNGKDELAEEETIGDLINESASRASSVCLALNDLNNDCKAQENESSVYHSNYHSKSVSCETQNKIVFPAEDIKSISAFCHSLSQDILSQAASEFKYAIADSEPKDLESPLSIETDNNQTNSPVGNIDKCALERKDFGCTNLEVITISDKLEDTANLHENVIDQINNDVVHTPGLCIETKLLEVSALPPVSEASLTKSQDNFMLKSPTETSNVNESSQEKIEGCAEIIEKLTDDVSDSLVSDATSNISENSSVTHISKDTKIVTNVVTVDCSGACSDLIIEAISTEKKLKDLQIDRSSDHYLDKSKFQSDDKSTNDPVKPQQRKRPLKSFAVSDFLQCVNEGLGSFRTMDIGGGGDRKEMKNPNGLPGDRIKDKPKSTEVVNDNESSQTHVYVGKDRYSQFMPDLELGQEISKENTCCQSLMISGDKDNAERKGLDILDQCHEEKVEDNENYFMNMAKINVESQLKGKKNLDTELNFLLLESVREDNHAVTLDKLVREHKEFCENFSSHCSQVPEVFDLSGLLEKKQFVENVDWQDVCDDNNSKLEKIHCQIKEKLLAVEMERKNNANIGLSSCKDEKLSVCQPESQSEKQLKSRKRNEQTGKGKYKSPHSKENQNESYEDELHQYKNYRQGKQMSQAERECNQKKDQRGHNLDFKLHSVKTIIQQEQEGSLRNKKPDRPQDVTPTNMVCKSSVKQSPSKKSVVQNKSSGDFDNAHNKSSREKSNKECRRLDDMLKISKEQGCGNMNLDRKSKSSNKENLTDVKLKKSDADRQVESKDKGKQSHLSDLDQSVTLPAAETKTQNKFVKDVECQELDNMHEAMLRRRQERKKMQEKAKLTSQGTTLCDNPDTLIMVDQGVSSAAVDVLLGRKVTVDQGVSSAAVDVLLGRKVTVDQGVSSAAVDVLLGRKVTVDQGVSSAAVDLLLGKNVSVDQKEEKLNVGAFVNVNEQNDSLSNEPSLKSKCSSQIGEISAKPKVSHMKQIELQSCKEKRICSKSETKVKQKPSKPSKSKARRAGLEVSDGSTSTTTSNISLSSTSDISDVNLSDLEHETGAILQSQCYANRYADEVGHGFKKNVAINLNKSVLSLPVLKSSYETANNLGSCLVDGNLSNYNPDEGHLKHLSVSMGGENGHNFFNPGCSNHSLFDDHLGDTTSYRPQDTEKPLPTINTDYNESISPEKVSHLKPSQSISKNLEYSTKKAAKNRKVSNVKHPDSRTKENKSKEKKTTQKAEKRDILEQESSGSESEDECSSCHQFNPLFHPSYSNYGFPQGYSFTPWHATYSQHLPGVPHSFFPYSQGYMPHSPFAYYLPYNSFYLSQPLSPPSFPYPSTFAQSAILYHRYINYMTNVLCSMTKKFHSGED